jgi:hypothetical protein
VSRYLAAAVTAAGLCLFAACGSDDSPSRPSSIAIRVSDPSEDKVVLAAPASVGAGVVRIMLENRGDTDHDAQLFRVDGRRSAQDVWSVLESADGSARPAWLHPAGGVAPIAPGESATVTGALEPGTYFVADTQERRSGSGGKITNAVKGGVAKLEVEGDAGGDLPATRASIVASDGRFETAGIEPGRNRVTFENRGEEPHQAVALPIDEGVPFAAAERKLLIDQGDTAWVPVDVPGKHATTVLEAGGKQVAEMTFAPGRYALVCFVADREGGPPHLQEGMASELRVSSETERQDAGAR